MSDGSNGSGSAIPDGLVSKIEAQLVATIWLCGAKALGSAPFDPRWVNNPRVRSIVQGALELDGDGVDYTPEQLVAKVPWLVDNLDWVSKLVDESIGLSTPEDLGRNLPLLEQAWRLRQLKIAGSDLVRQPESSEVIERVKALIEAPIRGGADDYCLNFRSFLGENEPSDDDDESWLVPGILPRNAPAALCGHPKTGKTLFAEAMAVCLATGIDFLGFPTTKCRSLIFPKEDPKRETRVRFWKFARGYGIADPRELDGEIIVQVDKPLYLDDKDDLARLKRTLDRWRPGVVFIDSLSRVHTGDENSKKEMAAVVRAWADLSAEFETCICMIHHFNGKGAQGDTRSPGFKMRGTSDLFAVVRHVIGMESIPDQDPAKKLRLVSVDGNLPNLPDPFVVEISAGQLESGKRTLNFVHRGTPAELNKSRLTVVITDLLKESGGAMGISSLRAAIRTKQGSVGNDLLDSTLHALRRDGVVDKEVTGERRWRLVGWQSGVRNGVEN